MTDTSGQPVFPSALAGYVVDHRVDRVDVRVNWGDGNEQTFEDLAPRTYFRVDHGYAAEGGYTITVTSTDDEGAQGISTFDATIIDTAGYPRGGVLGVFGVTPEVEEGEPGVFLIRRFGPPGESAVSRGETAMQGPAEYGYYGAATPGEPRRLSPAACRG
jgi:hypothetical protein